MSKDRHELRNRMLAAYGADIRKWPAGRWSGAVGLLTSAAYRRDVAAARRLDLAIAVAATPIRDGARLERRLLAAMGFTDERASSARPGFNSGWATAMAAVCLCLGVALGGVYGGDAANDLAYAVTDDGLWDDIDQDVIFEDLG